MYTMYYPLETIFFIFLSRQFNRLVMSNSLQPIDCTQLASLTITNSQSMLKFMSTELVMPSNPLIL